MLDFVVNKESTNMAKLDWQYENLPIASQDVIATYAYWVVHNTSELPTNFSQGIAEFAKQYRDTRVIEEVVHSVYQSRHALDLALFRVLCYCPIFMKWMELYQWRRVDVARELAEMAWADAVRFVRIKEREDKRYFWERLWDWLH
jgi:hypothetical protein